MRIKILLMVFLLLSNFYCSKNDNEKIENTNQEITNELSFYTKKENSKILILNDNAVKLLQDSEKVKNMPTVRDSLLNVALLYLNKAIMIDSTFYNAFLNKSTVLMKLGEYEKAVECLEKILSYKNIPEAYFIIGLIYEKIGKNEQAKVNYRKALNLYDNYINSPLSTARDKLNREYVLLLLEGKEKLLKRINKQLEKDPDNPTLLFNKSIILEFNRKTFINSL